jgi:hypothetical protein
MEGTGWQQSQSRFDFYPSKVKEGSINCEQLVYAYIRKKQQLVTA